MDTKGEGGAGTGGRPRLLTDDDDFPTDSVLPVILFLLTALVLLGCLKLCQRIRGRGGRQEDEESLEPDDEGGGCFSFFSCCSETGKEAEGVQESPLTSLGEDTDEVIISTSHDVKRELENLQRSLHDQTKEEGIMTICLAQELILAQNRRPTEESLQTCLVIGVDARPTVMAGYCVNLRELTMEWYVIKMEDFPWTLEDTNDPDEFEMKNLQFALCLWGKQILKYKTFRVYTDNHSIANENNEFGADAVELIEHFTECQDARKINSQEHVSRKQRLPHFAIYIQPADDLSRWEIDRAVDFLTRYYGVERKNVHGTMKLMRKETNDSRAWYDPSGNYTHFIQRAKAFVRNFKCENCIIDVFSSAPPPQAPQDQGGSRSRSRGRNEQVPQQGRQGQSQSQNRTKQNGNNRRRRGRSRRRRGRNIGQQEQMMNRFMSGIFRW